VDGVARGSPLTLALDGKRAVVTGGASGIGQAIVLHLHGAGVRNGVVLDLPDAIARGSFPTGWRPVSVDLRDDANVAAAFGEVKDVLRRIDVLVAAAGIVPAWTGIGALDPAEWDDVFRVNARGVMRCIQEAQALMPPGASIIVIASQNAWRGNENLASYVASKHAALGLVRSVALELGPRSIRVNAIGPGSVPTAAYLERLRRREDENGLTVDAALDRDRLATPLQQLASVDDVAGATLLLASDLASGITGHILPVGAPL
jgi:NAD(P)-dependent dehydrogenase (short-subunit alcohol dehydrogenase family)